MWAPASFAGARLSLLLDDKFMIGVAGYGMTKTGYVPMGYEGVVFEFLPHSDRLAHVLFGGLMGVGGRFNTAISVAEPEVRLNLNAAKWLRLGVGGGYRLVGGGGILNPGLRGPQATFSVGFGR